MTLIHTATASAYTCPSCAADFAETLLDGSTARTVIDSLVFTQCDHGDTGRVCWPCLEAVKAELKQRWARALLTDKPAANRLGRLLNTLSRRYDRKRVTAAERQAQIDAKRAKAETPAQYPGLGRSGAPGDRARAGERWEADRAHRLKLNALRPPFESVVVVSPA
jgi:hypothetical protein